MTKHLLPFFVLLCYAFLIKGYIPYRKPVYSRYTLSRHSTANSNNNNSNNNSNNNNNNNNNNSGDEEFLNVQMKIEALIKKNQSHLPPIVTTSSNIDTSSSSSSKSSNRTVAILSSVIALFLLGYQKFVPVSSLGLLKAMEKDSISIQTAVCNGKPTLIDFYADWCENCKSMAPAMRAIEFEYNDKVNFVTVDGANNRNADLVRRFRVDGIPHVALLTPGAEVKTALVGAVPKQILTSDIDALLQGNAMPYEGYDAFEDESHFPFSDTKNSYCPSMSYMNPN